MCGASQLPLVFIGSQMLGQRKKCIFNVFLAAGDTPIYLFNIKPFFKTVRWIVHDNYERKNIGKIQAYLLVPPSLIYEQILQAVHQSNQLGSDI